MAQNKKTKNSEGFCRKIYNAVSPFRSRIFHVSHQPHNSMSITSDQKPVQNPKPVHVLHQPNLSKMVPVELEHTQKNNNGAIKSGQEFGEREILIVSGGQKVAKTEKAPNFSGQKHGANKDNPSNHVPLGKAKSHKEDDPVHESKFNDYIAKVRKRLLKTASSHIGDSFKDLH